ncbi:hypothetical protein ACFQH8_05260 [Halomicroarcula sp. GCM10025710]
MLTRGALPVVLAGDEDAAGGIECALREGVVDARERELRQLGTFDRYIRMSWVAGMMWSVVMLSSIFRRASPPTSCSRGPSAARRRCSGP